MKGSRSEEVPPPNMLGYVVPRNPASGFFFAAFAAVLPSFLLLWLCANVVDCSFLMILGGVFNSRCFYVNFLLMLSMRLRPLLHNDMISCRWRLELPMRAVILV